jgi:hypothetical protein
MSEFVRAVRVVTALSVLAAGGMALWSRRDQVKRVWDSLGGVEGIANSANKLVESVGPVREVVSQFSGLKKL